MTLDDSPGIAPKGKTPWNCAGSMNPNVPWNCARTSGPPESLDGGGGGGQKQSRGPGEREIQVLVSSCRPSSINDLNVASVSS